jgi:hypothetical protein
VSARNFGGKLNVSARSVQHIHGFVHTLDRTDVVVWIRQEFVASGPSRKGRFQCIYPFWGLCWC